MTALELMLYVTEPDVHIYYHKDTKEFDFMPVSSVELEHIDWNARISDRFINNIPFLTYKEIDHENLMRFFVHECVDDKEQRKKLFYTLRRDKYVEPFVAALKELELYDDYVIFSENVYNQMFREWAEKNGLTF